MLIAVDLSQNEPFFQSCLAVNMMSEWNRFSGDSKSLTADPTTDFNNWLQLLMDQRANELGNYMAKTWGFNAGPIEAPMSSNEFRRFE